LTCAFSSFMPDSKRIRLYYEGDDDRNVLEQMKGGGLLAGNVEVAKRRKDCPGREGMVQDLAPFVGIGGRAVALTDLDGNIIESLTKWFQNTLQAALAKEEPPGTINAQERISDRISTFACTSDQHTGHVALIAVGLPEDEEIKSSQIDRFAIDDYLLRLARDPQIYESNPDLCSVPYAGCMKKLMEMVQLLRQNDIPIRNSKRYLHFLRAITNFRPSSAEFAGRLVGKAIDSTGQGRLRELFSPLLEDLQIAIKQLSS